MKSIIKKIIKESEENNYNFNIKKLQDNYIKINCNLNNEKIGYCIFSLFNIESGFEEINGVISDINKYLKLIKDSDFGIINVLSIKEKYQSKGLGKELLLKAINYIKENNCKSIILNAYQIENKSLDYIENFYIKFGFKTIKSIDNSKVMIKYI